MSDEQKTENNTPETPAVGFSPAYMQSEPAPTYDTFDIPEGDVSYLSYDESQTAIAKLERDMRNPSHPLNPTRSDIDPQRKAFMEYRSALYQQKADTNETPNFLNVALEQAQQAKVEKEKAIRDAAVKDWDRLIELGYEGDVEPPKNISEARAKIYRMQVLNAEGGAGNLSQLSNMIREDLKRYNEPPELRNLFDAFVGADIFDEALRSDLVYQILKYLDAKSREQKPTSFRPGRFGG